MATIETLMRMPLLSATAEVAVSGTVRRYGNGNSTGSAEAELHYVTGYIAARLMAVYGRYAHLRYPKMAGDGDTVRLTSAVELDGLPAASLPYDLEVSLRRETAWDAGGLVYVGDMECLRKRVEGMIGKAVSTDWGLRPDITLNVEVSVEVRSVSVERDRALT